jgi:hypothetical protein
MGTQGGSTAQRRSLRSLDTTLKRLNGQISQREAERERTALLASNLTKGAARFQRKLLGQDENGATRGYRTFGRISAGLDARVNEFRSARRKYSGFRAPQRRGPKPDRRSWQERFGLDADDQREDKKCGASAIEKSKKCHKGSGKGRQAAKAAATAALVAGGAVALRQAGKAGLGKTKATPAPKGPWVASKGRRMTAKEIESLREMRERGQGKYGAQPRRRTGDAVEHHGETFSDYNKPKRTPNHPSKSHAVLAREGGEVKLIRFGQQGVQGSPPKKGESKAYASRRRAWKARHAENIAKGKMSAAYWANQAKWDRTDAAGEKRLGKPCGESHIPKAHKCNKNKGNAVKAVLATAGIAGALTLYVKRREAQSALTKAVFAAEKKLNSAGSQASYEAFRDKIPQALRGQADQLTGTARATASALANYASNPIDLKGVNAKQGYVTGKFRAGDEYISLGAVGRDVIEVRTEKSSGRQGEWTVQFTVNDRLVRKDPRTPKEASAILRTVRSMVKDQAKILPKGATLFAEPAVGDGAEAARSRIYKRWGFQDDGDGGLTMRASDI